MVFGEHMKENKRNRLQRQWYIGEQRIEEVDHIDHVGIKLCAYFSNKLMIGERCKRGKGLLAGLSSAGLRAQGLNPLISASLWSKICIPSMLHGAELWGNLKKTEWNELEKAQKYAGKVIQGLQIRTHDWIVRGLLGWSDMEGIIEDKQLAFLQKLASLDNCVTKSIFLCRLYEYIIQLHDNMSGYIPRVITLLSKYGMLEFMTQYIVQCSFPDKRPWKRLVKQSLITEQNRRYNDALHAKGDSDRFL
jgi:hypothetical protein